MSAHKLLTIDPSGGYVSACGDHDGSMTEWATSWEHVTCSDCIAARRDLLVGTVPFTYPDADPVQIATASADHLVHQYHLLMETIVTERQRIAEQIMLLDVPLSAVTVESKRQQEGLREQWQRLAEIAHVR